MSPDSGPSINVPVAKMLEDLGQELARGFENVGKQLDKLETRLDQKASVERVAALESSMGQLELRLTDRLSKLENKESATSAVSGLQGKWTLAAMGFVFTLITALIYLASSGVHG